MTNPRDLIKRLADSLHEAAGEVEGWGNYASSYFQEKHDLRGNVARIYAEAAEARAYLAQPKPQAPSKHELFGLLMQSGGANRVVSIEWLEPFAHAVLERWGLPAAEPVPANELVDLAIESNALRLITPIPVSERPILKASDFNDADGRCWCGSGGFIDETGDMPVEMPASWELREPCSQDDWVLPHYALPVPTH